MKLYFLVSDEFIKSELLKGNEVTKNQCIDIDFSQLTEYQRQMIVKHSKLFPKDNYLVAGAFGKKTIPTPNRYLYEINYNTDAYTLNGTSIDAIVSSFEDIEKKQKTMIAEEKAEKELEISKFINHSARDMRIFGTGIHEDFSGNFDFERLEKYYNQYSDDYNGLSVSFDQLKEKAAEYVALKEQHMKALKDAADKKEAEKAAAEAQKEAKKQELKAWALANGSELLKARIEENLNWFELADTEYDHSRMPDGFDYKDEDDFDSCWDYKNPTLEHIQALREARKNEVFESVELRKCRKTDEDGDKTFYFFIVGTMLGSDGTEFEVSKLIDQKYVSAEE